MGLQSLQYDLLPRIPVDGGAHWGGQVMVVHGFTRDIAGCRQFSIRRNPARRPFVVLTGVFLNKVQLDRSPPRDKECWKLIWERAQAVWPAAFQTNNTPHAVSAGHSDFR